MCDKLYKFRAPVIATALMAMASPAFSQSTLTWDSSGTNAANPVDGAGTWDTTTALWSNGASDSAWNNANNDIAIFGANNGAAGTVTLGAGITAGGVTFNAPGSGNYVIDSDTLTLTGTATVTTNVDGTINSAIAGSAGLTKAGAGTLVLGGVNTYTGGTFINAGTLSFSHPVVGNAGSIPAGNVTILDGAKLQYTGTATNGFNRALILGAGTTTIEATSTTSNAGLTFSGSVGSTGSGARTLVLESVSQGASSFNGAIADGTGGATSLIKNGTGIWNLSGANTYTGTTTINAGSLALNAANTLPTTGTVIIASGATLRVNQDQTIGELQDGTGGGGLVRNLTNASTKTLTVGSGAFSGSLQDGAAGRVLALTKNTSGTLTLSGANTYTGATNVSEGTLLVEGSLGTTAVTVGSTGILGGNGTLGGSLHFDSGADFVFSLTDTLTVNGASVSFGGFGIGNLFGLDSSVAEGAYTLMDGSAVFDLTNVSNFGIENAANIGGGKQAYFQSGSFQVVVAAIPEPATWGLLAVAGLAAVVMRRRV